MSDKHFVLDSNSVIVNRIVGSVDIPDHTVVACDDLPGGQIGLKRVGDEWHERQSDGSYAAVEPA